MICPEEERVPLLLECYGGVQEDVLRSSEIERSCAEVPASVMVNGGAV